MRCLYLVGVRKAGFHFNYNENATIRTRIIDLIQDTCHLCTRLRTDGINAISRGFSWGKQVKKMPIEETAVEFV